MAVELPEGVRLRTATPHDRVAVGRLLVASGQAADADRLPPGRLYVAEARMNVVGVAGLQEFGGDALVSAACVHPAWRGQGIGSGLIEHVLTEAALEALDAVYVVAMTATGFFARFGFREADAREIPDPVARATWRDGRPVPGATTMLLRLAAT